MLALDHIAEIALIEVSRAQREGFKSVSDITIKSDRKWKFLVYRYDVPAKVLASQFDYQDADETHDGYFCYKGNWYHVDMFIRLDGATGEDLAGWHGYHSDSAFSGVVIRLSSDGESYMVGTYVS